MRTTDKDRELEGFPWIADGSNDNDLENIAATMPTDLIPLLQKYRQLILDMTVAIITSMVKKYQKKGLVIQYLYAAASLSLIDVVMTLTDSVLLRDKPTGTILKRYLKDKVNKW